MCAWPLRKVPLGRGSNRHECDPPFVRIHHGGAFACGARRERRGAAFITSRRVKDSMQLPTSQAQEGAHIDKST